MRRLCFALATIVLAGCSAGSEKATVHLTEHQRDSILATEGAIPGSATVGRALQVQARAATRAAGMDTLSNE